MSQTKVEFIVGVIDQASAKLDQVGKNVGKMSDDIVSTGDKISGRAKKNEKTFKGMATYGAATVGAVTGLVYKSLDAWGTQAKAVALVENGMKKYADTWTTTTDDLLAEAARLQQNSIFGDEEILQKVTNNLLTFGSIGEEIFNKAQQTALDLSTTLEGDLQSSAIMLGKALEDPTKGLSALSRVGIKFTAEQEEMIVALQESGDLLGAQNYILEGIEGLYGGAAQAAADALGPTHQLNKEMGDMRESIGQQLRPAIDALAESIRPIIQQFASRVSENGKLFSNILIGVGILGGLVSGLGVLGLAIPSIVTGFKAVVVATKLVGASFSAVGGPITLLIVAIGILVYFIIDNWDRIVEKTKRFVDQTVQFFRGLGLFFSEWGAELSEAWSILRSGIVDRALGVWNTLGEAFSNIMSWIGDTARNIRQGVRDTFVNYITGIIDFIMNSRQLLSQAFEMMINGFGGIAKNVLNGVISIIESFVNRAIGGLNNMIALANKIPGVSIQTIAPVKFGRLVHGGIAGEGFFGGGVVKGQAGIDAVPTMLTAGELVLNRSQQSNLANQLEGGGGKTYQIILQDNVFYGSDRQFMQKLADFLIDEVKLHQSIPSF